jgi:hypothetical protein
MIGLKLLLSIIVLIIIILYYCKKTINSTYVKSNVDNNYYLVRDLHDKQEVADTLAYIKIQLRSLIKYILSSKSNKFTKYIKDLEKKFDNVNISENITDFYYTSFSVNKGEQIVFCMRSRKDKDKQHDTNLMMYVALHEISHIACPEYGHTELFKEIFQYITQNAINLNMYHSIDFKNLPTEYCGIVISDSIV